jgi:hypothetical protein
VALYCVAKGLRSAHERLGLSLLLDVPDPRVEWEARYCCIETALRGLRLTADGAPVPPQIRAALAGQDVVTLVVPVEHHAVGKMRALCRTEGYRMYDLRVRFAEGGEHDYGALLGTASLLGGAALFPILQASKGQGGTAGGPIIL